MKVKQLVTYSLLIGALSLTTTIYAKDIDKTIDTNEVTTTTTTTINITNDEDNIDEYLNIEMEEDLDDYTNYKEISSRVYTVQKTLKYLGYYNGELSGIFDEKTLESLIIFQDKNGLLSDGKLTTSTLEKIDSFKQEVEKLENEEFNKKIEENRKKIEAEIKAKNAAKLVDWFKEGQYLIPRKSTFKVTDVKTGKSFMAYRMGGTNHCDTEPLTKEDTAIMKSIYGSWSWDRRAIVIEPQNSNIRIAASMAGMPHSTQHKTGNNFNGHFDIHLYNSKTHYDPANGVYAAKIEPWHQRTLKLAVGK